MFDKKENRVVLATFGLIIFCIIGSMICNFQLIDLIYIVSVAIYIIQYKLHKSDDNYTK